MRFLFFLLLVINAAFGAHLWLSHAKGAADDPGKREINPDAMKIVAIADPKVAASTAARRREISSAPGGSSSKPARPCVTQWP